MRKQLYCFIAVLLIGVLIGTGIYYTQEYRYYNMESNDLFLYDGADIENKIGQSGGLALLIASFLSQFMRIPYVGICIMVILYMSIAWIAFRVFQYKMSGWRMAGLSLLPITFLYLCMENDYYHFQGHIAFLLMMLALWGYLSISDSKWKIRLIVGLVLIPLLYQLAGSIVWVFVVVACLSDLFGKGIKACWTLLYPLIALFIACILVENSIVDTWETALTPFMYYNWPSTYFFPLYAWGTIPLLWIVAWGLTKIPMKPTTEYLCGVLGGILSFYMAADIYHKVHSRSSYRFLQEQYWAEQGDWDRIIETADRRQPVFFISHLNLALAKKGLLVQRGKQYNQQPISKLMYPDPNLKNGMSLQSKVYLSWGYTGAARQAAFDANLVTPGSCHPRQMQVMVQTNLVLGSYDVAEKYISVLEKTLFYDEWASSMRKFLNNPEAVSQDGILSELYHSLPLTDEYIRYEGLWGDMRDILEVCPSHPILSQFYKFYQLLEKEEQL